MQQRLFFCPTSSCMKPPVVSCCTEALTDPIRNILCESVHVCVCAPNNGLAQYLGNTNNSCRWDGKRENCNRTADSVCINEDWELKSDDDFAPFWIFTPLQKAFWRLRFTYRRRIWSEGELGFDLRWLGSRWTKTQTSVCMFALVSLCNWEHVDRLIKAIIHLDAMNKTWMKVNVLFSCWSQTIELQTHKVTKTHWAVQRSLLKHCMDFLLILKSLFCLIRTKLKCCSK